MKRFHWPMERLLKVTARREEAQRAQLRALAERLRDTRRLQESRLAALRNSLEDLARLEAPARLTDQGIFMKYLPQAQQELAHLAEQAAALETQKKEMMAAVLKTRQRRRTLDRLREEALKEHLRRQEALEQKQFDEVAHLAFVRTGGTEERSRLCSSSENP